MKHCDTIDAITGELGALARSLELTVDAPGAAHHFGGEYDSAADTLRLPFLLEGKTTLTLTIQPVTSQAVRERAKKLHKQAKDAKQALRPAPGVRPPGPPKVSTKQCAFLWRLVQAFIEDGEWDNLREYFALYGKEPITTHNPSGPHRVLIHPQRFEVEGIEAYTGRVWTGARWQWTTVEPHTGASLHGANAVGAGHAAYKAAAKRSVLRVSADTFAKVKQQIAAARQAGEAAARAREALGPATDITSADTGKAEVSA